MAGTVRISSALIIVNHILVPHLSSRVGAHPGLTVEIVPTPGILDLSKREADLAVRFRRPADGGLRVKAQKLGALPFAAYRPACSRSQTLRWVTYDDASAGLPHSKWLERRVGGKAGSRCSVRVMDADTAFEALANGSRRMAPV